MSIQLKGSTVLLTGANGGIGRAFVEEILKRDVQKLYVGVRKVGGHNFPADSRIEEVQLDVANQSDIDAVASKVKDVNILISNAGFAAFTGAVTADNLDAAYSEMETNYFGPLKLTRALKDTPVFSDNGAIVYVTSFLALATLPVAGTYSASKAAIHSLTRTVRAELKPKGTRVVAVLPVQTDTPMAAALPEPKVKPAEVAIETLNAIESGQEEVYPGVPSKSVAEAFKSNPLAVQQQFSSFVHALN